MAPAWTQTHDATQSRCIHHGCYERVANVNTSNDPNYGNIQQYQCVHFRAVSHISGIELMIVTLVGQVSYAVSVCGIQFARPMYGLYIPLRPACHEGMGSSVAEGAIIHLDQLSAVEVINVQRTCTFLFEQLAVHFVS